MSWVGIANNQTVSFNNLQDAVNIGYFYALTTIPSSLEQITKSDASTYVSIDTAYAPYAAKASNQLVVKSDLKPIFQYSGTFYYFPDTKGWYGWASSIDACTNYSSGSSITVYWNGSLNVGSLIFISTPFGLDLGTYPYFAIDYAGTVYWITFSGVGYYNPTTGEIAYTVSAVETCPIGPLTFYVSDIDAYDVCNFTNPVTVWYSPPAGSGTIIYTDSALTTPLTGWYFTTFLSSVWTIDPFTGAIGYDTTVTC